MPVSRARDPARFLCLVLATAALAEGAGLQRAHRRVEGPEGPPVLPIYGMGQDTTGYLWLATEAGIGRYDGFAYRNWSERPPRDRPMSVITGPDGEVVVLDQGGALLKVTGNRVEPVPGPEGKPLVDAEAAAFGPDGSLWVAGTDSLRMRRAGVWAVAPTPTAMRIHAVAPTASGNAIVATGTGVYRLAADGTASLLHPSPHAVKVLPLDGEACAVLLWEGTGGRLVEISRGKAHAVAEVPGRPIDVVRRAGTLWVSTDRYLAAIPPGRPPEIMGPEDGLPGGGPLFVDREGSLWLGTFVGLLHLPEPDTLLLRDGAGLPSSHTLYIDPSREGLWVSTWQGGALLREGAGGIEVERHPQRGIGRGCVDARGTLWSSRTDWASREFALLERRPSGEVEHRLEGFRTIANCARSLDGGLWMAANIGLLRSRPEGGTPIRVEEPARPDRRESDPTNRRVFEDSRGRLWLARGRSICETTARTAAGAPSWSCATIEAMRHATAFAEPSPGVVWVSTAGGGVQRFDGKSWQPVAASATFPTAEALGLRHSPRGGVWVLTHRTALRVRDRPELPTGWEVLEELTGWHGIPAGARTDLLEQEDGTIWIATSMGVVRLPARARQPPEVPPRVEVAEMLVDGQRLELGTPVRLPYHRNRLELRFSALSFRDPERLRYRIRSGRDLQWSHPAASPFVRFVDLSPGAHRVEVAASLDGAGWSAAPAVVEFEVGAPWFRHPLFLALVVLALAAGAYGVHRARVASLLRLARQRSRIARDLHDEMGSGLGSIGILADLAADQRLDESRRRALSTQIAQTAGELGTTLDEIVWSLRAGAESLEDLAEELRTRGRRLFPEGRVAFRTDFPGPWPVVRLSPEVRRQVLAIGLEAMHNAARHARATSVTLRIEPRDGVWRLRVEDDGVGIPPAAEVERGHGRAGMCGRAGEIGATVAWEARPGGGTVVSVDFDPAAGGRRGEP